MSTTIYLVRHAEAEGNLGRRCHGHYDSMLTQRGLEQAEVVGKRFADTYLDAVYSSDLWRARFTAMASRPPAQADSDRTSCSARDLHGRLGG